MPNELQEKFVHWNLRGEAPSPHKKLGKKKKSAKNPPKSLQKQHKPSVDKVPVKKEIPAEKPKEKLSLKASINFFISMCYNKLLPREPYSTVLKNEYRIVNGKKVPVGNIYLGSMPLERSGLNQVKHDEKILTAAQNDGRPLGLVVSAVQKPETSNKGICFFKPVGPENWWKKHQVRSLFVPVEDYKVDIDFTHFSRAMKDIEATINSGNSVLIHCKAGRSRSVALAIASFMLFVTNPKTNELYTFNEAYEKVKSGRPFIDFKKPHKQAAVENLVKLYKAEQREEKNLLKRAQMKMDATEAAAPAPRKR